MSECRYRRIAATQELEGDAQYMSVCIRGFSGAMPGLGVPYSCIYEGKRGRVGVGEGICTRAELEVPMPPGVYGDVHGMVHGDVPLVPMPQRFPSCLVTTMGYVR